MGVGGGIEIDFKALGIGAIFIALTCLLLGYRPKSPLPTLLFSTLNILKNYPKGLKAKWARLPKLLELFALGLFLAALIDIRIFLPRELSPKEIPPTESTEGIAIYLLLDQSGSMAEPATGYSSGTKPITKIQLLKTLTRDFIQGNPNENLSGRPNDLIGMVAFARVPNVLAPLTIDHQSILEALKKFDVVNDKTHDGTAIGYAIYKTANMIAATRHFAEEIHDANALAYDIKSTIMILITDGVQEINPEDQGNTLRTIDVPEAAAYAKDQHIRLYIVNIEPLIASEEFAPFRHQMQKAAESTGGKFFMMSSGAQLASVYREIDRLEKSRLPWEVQLEQMKQMRSRQSLPYLFSRFPLYPIFIGAGMGFLLAAVILKSTWMRQMP